MTDNERDTHFQVFADSLANDLAALNGCQWNNLDDYIAAKRLLIARRAYDFAVFLFESADPLHFDVRRAYHERPGEGIYDYHQFVKQLPDMTAFPLEPA